MRPRPEFVSPYSTRGGCSPKSRLVISPSFSSSLRCCVSIFCEMSGMSRNNCEVRIDGSANRRNKIGSFHRPLIMRSTLVTCATEPSGPRQTSLSSRPIGTFRCVIALLIALSS
jgi:hypothetical protein